jgi:hypothetical protein
VAIRTDAQLEVIVEQMKALQERAREIIEQASRDIDLIHAECRFRRVPGRTYHLVFQGRCRCAPFSSLLAALRLAQQQRRATAAKGI